MQVICLYSYFTIITMSQVLYCKIFYHLNTGNMAHHWQIFHIQLSFVTLFVDLHHFGVGSPVVRIIMKVKISFSLMSWTKHHNLSVGFFKTLTAECPSKDHRPKIVALTGTIFSSLNFSTTRNYTFNHNKKSWFVTRG